MKLDKSIPVGLAPCVLKCRRRFTEAQWQSLVEDDDDARNSVKQAIRRVMSKAHARLLNKPFGWHPKVANWLLDPNVWIGKNCDLSLPEAWQRPWTQKHYDAAAKEKQTTGRTMHLSDNTSFGEKVMMEMERLLRFGKWEVIQQCAAINVRIQKRKSPRGRLSYPPRSVLLINNWVRLLSIDANLPGLAYFQTTEQIEILKKIIAPLTFARLKKLRLELGLRPIKSHTLKRLPIATWATQLIG